MYIHNSANTDDQSTDHTAKDNGDRRKINNKARAHLLAVVRRCLSHIYKHILDEDITHSFIAPGQNMIEQVKRSSKTNKREILKIEISSKEKKKMCSTQKK